MQQSLIKPIITEKSARAAKSGVYTFLTRTAATKSGLKALIEALFAVHVSKLTTTTRLSSARRTGRRRLPSPPQQTKIVRATLRSGETINLFDLT